MKTPKFLQKLKLRKKDRRTPLERERDAYIEDVMWAHRDDPDEYGICCENVAILTEAVNEESTPAVSWVDVLIAGVPLAGTALICFTNWKCTKRVTVFEETDVLTTKAHQVRLPFK